MKQQARLSPSDASQASSERFSAKPDCSAAEVTCDHL